MRKACGTASISGAYIEFQAAVLKALPRDLPEDVVLGWAQNGKSLARVLREALSPDGKSAREFPAWKTITLGTFKDVKSLKKALEKKGFRVSDWANDLLGQPAFTLASEEMEVSLDALSVAELGFPKSATLKEIYTRAQELGFKLCPAEVGPQLRLQYPDQSAGEWLRIAMEPITGSDGRPRLFGVGHGQEGWWLDEYCSLPDYFWGAGGQFVFAR